MISVHGLLKHLCEHLDTKLSYLIVILAYHQLVLDSLFDIINPLSTVLYSVPLINLCRLINLFVGVIYKPESLFPDSDLRYLL